MGPYHNNKKKFFKPTDSSTFKLVKLGNVNVTFLDKTNLLGYDGQDMAKLGKYSVETRLGMITHCNSANFNDVDGIIGFRSLATKITYIYPFQTPVPDIDSQRERLERVRTALGKFTSNQPRRTKNNDMH